MVELFVFSQAVFIDEVTVTPVQLTGSVPIVNGGFDADTLTAGATTGTGYNYQVSFFPAVHLPSL